MRKKASINKTVELFNIRTEQDRSMALLNVKDILDNIGPNEIDRINKIDYWTGVKNKIEKLKI